MKLEEQLKEREAQVLATTDEDRDAMDEENPIINAEGAPNRFQVMALFFDDTDSGDGVRIQEDLDLGEVTVTYFNKYRAERLDSGPVYEWALNFYRENY
jgi:hypothetical protein